VRAEGIEVFETAWGWMGLAWRGGRLCRVLLPRRRRQLSEEARSLGFGMTTGAKSRLARQLVCYFAGERVEMSAPLQFPPASPFRRRVWEVTAAVPYGAVLTYGEVAARAGRPKAARAVGQALARNPLPLVVPCHRVVAADGGLGGFSGEGGVRVKRRLLELEGGGARPRRGRTPGASGPLGEGSRKGSPANLKKAPSFRPGLAPLGRGSPSSASPASAASASTPLVWLFRVRR
jgi:methylated-DNA-[protein]-cysteine S-methyltransferase